MLQLMLLSTIPLHLECMRTTTAASRARVPNTTPYSLEPTSQPLRLRMLLSLESICMTTPASRVAYARQLLLLLRLVRVLTMLLRPESMHDQSCV
jgi:hypothetical protein